jgi:hypothetical protein
MSAKHLGCKAVIAMPTVTPDIKVNRHVLLLGCTTPTSWLFPNRQRQHGRMTDCQTAPTQGHGLTLAYTIAY